MAEKIINFVYEGKEVPVIVEATIKREELYGKQIKVIEKDGIPLKKGILTQSGTLFPATAFGSVKVDSQGSLDQATIPKTQEGKEAPIYTSSFKESRKIVKIEPEKVADIAVTSVLPAQQSILPEGFYEGEYTYRDSTKLQTAVLVVKANKETFLLIGDKKETPLLGKLETYDFFDGSDEVDSEEESEEVDFNMF